jgi:hypothetical protein
MSKPFRIIAVICLALMPLVFGGCEGAEWLLISPAYSLVAGSGGGGNDGGSTPVGPHVGGKWSGEYGNDDTGESMAITASIKQDGSSLSIKTSKSGIAHAFTGTIEEDGYIRVTDAYDGQTWTSHQQTTANHLMIEDYTHRPTIYDDSDPPIQYIILDR